MPVGPTGCNASRGEGETPSSSGFMVALLHGRSWSHLHFKDGSEPLMQQQTMAGTFGYFFENGWSLSASGGVIYGGDLQGDGKDMRFGPGWMASLRVAWRWLEQKGPRPFLMTSLTITVQRSASENWDGWKGHVLGTDFRLGFTAGWTIENFFSFHVTPRFFGGPIFIEENGKRIQGRDRWFFQLGLGAALLLPAGFTLFVDGSPGGEQALSGGLALSF